MSRTYDSIKSALESLEHGDVVRAKRYLGKALAELRCAICHSEMFAAERIEENVYFEGYAHPECLERYGTRREYEVQHSDEPWAVREREKREATR